MIPEFPVFTKITIDLKEPIRKFLANFESYSDFNYTSLYSWDYNYSSEICYLNHNLVIKIPDYITGSPTYSILGTQLLDDSIAMLLKYTKEINLVPEVTINSIRNKNVIEIQEDRDNYDYIYELENLVDLPGKGHKLKRNKLNQFDKAYPNHALADFTESIGLNAESYNDLFISWARERNRSNQEIQMEQVALSRLLLSADELGLISMELKIDGLLAGFSVCEVISDELSICHFQKALFKYNFADVKLTHFTSQILFDNKCTYINWEQDLGLLGLRQLKETYRPYKYLKKYTIRAV